MNRVLLLIVIPAIAAFAVTGCGGTPSDMTVHGTLEVAVQDYSEFAQLYEQAYTGNAQVTVTDPSGKVIAATTADGQKVNQSSQSETIVWGWTAKVPEGLSLYGVSVTEGAGKPLQFTAAQMKQGPGVCLGDACGG